MNHTNPEQKKRERRVVFSNSDYLDYAGFKRRKPKKHLTAVMVLLRILIVLNLILFLTASALIIRLYLVGGTAEIESFVIYMKDYLFEIS